MALHRVSRLLRGICFDARLFATNLVLADICGAITWIPAYLIRVRAMDTLKVGKARTLLSLLSFWTSFHYLMSARRPGARYRTN